MIRVGDKVKISDTINFYGGKTGRVTKMMKMGEITYCYVQFFGGEYVRIFNEKYLIKEESGKNIIHYLEF